MGEQKHTQNTQYTCQSRGFMQMGETPLIRCAHNGHFNCVKWLIEQGADINAIDLVQLTNSLLIEDAPYL